MTQAQQPKMQRPCPWCGGDASAHEVNPKDAPGWVHLTVVHRAGCLHRRAEEALLLSAYDLEKWNRRADDAENEQLRGSLEAQRLITDRAIAIAKQLEAQAQPAREPTTEKHLMELADSLGYEPLNPARVEFMYGYRKAERAHGIKGVAHGQT